MQVAVIATVPVIGHDARTNRVARFIEGFSGPRMLLIAEPAIPTNPVAVFIGLAA